MLRNDGISSENVRQYLCRLTGESAEWPTDDVFRDAWQNRHAYQTLQNPKIVHILRRLNDTYLNSKSECISIDSPLTVEHILPQDWLDHWRLPDDSKGLTPQELWNSQQGNSRAEATRRRNEILQTLGNLTILAQPLNSSMKNRSWKEKKPALMSASLLPINQQLNAIECWDETAIEKRSKELFNRAIKVWPGPKIEI